MAFLRDYKLNRDSINKEIIVSYKQIKENSSSLLVGDTGLILTSPEEYLIPYRSSVKINLGIILNLPKNVYCIIDSNYGVINNNIKLGIEEENYIELFNMTSVNGLLITVGLPIVNLIFLETLSPKLIRQSENDSQVKSWKDNISIDEEPEIVETVEIKY